MRRSLPSPRQPLALPADIRFMNGVSMAFAAVFALMALLLLMSWLFRHPIFNLSAISVQGDVARNNAITLRANVTPKLAGNFFTVNLAQTRAVFESVPWVRQAVVQRQFPDRLKVLLQEHQAVAFWGPEGDTRLVNSFGEVFEANQAELESSDLPQLEGPAGQAFVVLKAHQVLAAQFKTLDAQVEWLELTGQGSWRARLDSGAVLELGHGSLEEIEARVKRFVATLTQVSARYSRELESADLRYPNGYALTLKGVTTVNPADIADKKVKR